MQAPHEAARAEGPRASSRNSWLPPFSGHLAGHYVSQQLTQTSSSPSPTWSSLPRRVYKPFASSYKTLYKTPRPGSRRSRSIRRAPIRATCHSLTLIPPRSSASTKAPARTSGSTARVGCKAKKVGELTAITSSWEQTEYVMKTGWATFPGQADPNREVAEACAAGVLKIAAAK